MPRSCASRSYGTPPNLTLIAQSYLHVRQLDQRQLTLERSLEVIDRVATQAALAVYETVDLELVVEDGSRKVWATVLAVGAVLSQYGSIRSGADYLVNDAKQFGQIVSSAFVNEARVPPECVVRKERRLGAPGRLLRALKELDRLSQTPGATPAEIRAVSRQLEEVLRDFDDVEDRAKIRAQIPEPYGSKLPEPSLPTEAVPAQAPRVEAVTARRLRRRKRVSRPAAKQEGP